MAHLTIFKKYDIRGIYGTELTTSFAEKLGHALSCYFNKGTAVVGYDNRLSSPDLFLALCRGLNFGGSQIVNIGLCSTPMNYFANGSLKSSFSVMITASHNPKEWNGFKICGKNVTPLSFTNGLCDIKQLMRNLPDLSYPDFQPKLDLCIIPSYREHLVKHITFTRKPKIVIDYANAMGLKEVEAISDYFEIIALNDKSDGTYPAHEANPLKKSTLEELAYTVIEQEADFGVAFDGDADRAGFVDENGNIIGMDITGGMIARELIATSNNKNILYGIRCTHAVQEIIEESGGTAARVPVGHALIKEKMRKHDALFGFELSGHYYFKENYFSESQALALIYIANILEKQNRPFSEIAGEFQRYSHSGEINIEAKGVDSLINCLEAKYLNGKHDYLDGLTITFPDWWFNLRHSNTESLLRLVVETQNPQDQSLRINELYRLISEFSK